MRFIFKLLLGFVIFNAMLIILTPTFNKVSSSVDTEDVKTTLSSYQNIGSMIGSILSVSGVVMAGALAVAGGANWLRIANFPTGAFIGASFVVSIIIGLWSAVTTPLISITKTYTILDQWYTLFTICFGIIATISIAEIFTGKGDEG